MVAMPGKSIAEREPEHPASGEFLRDIVFGANDGVVTAIGFLVGISGSIANQGVVVIAGILTLARIFLVLAAMDIGTAFGSLGARREMFIASLSEPVLLLIFLNASLLTQATHLNIIGYFFIVHKGLYPGMIFSLLAFILVMLAETGRVPIDNPATHLELTMVHEAMVLEYSGRYLALIEWGNAIKFIIYLLLLIVLFVPYGLSTSLGAGEALLSIIAVLLKLMVLIGLVSLIESLNAKMRLFKVPEYLVGAFMLAVLGILLTQLLGVGV